MYIYSFPCSLKSHSVDTWVPGAATFLLPPMIPQPLYPPTLPCALLFQLHITLQSLNLPLDGSKH